MINNLNHLCPGVISINLDLCAESSGSKLLTMSGDNTGNLLFTSAVFSQVANATHLPASSSPSEINEKYSSIVIPAANWIYPKFDFGWLANLLEKTQLPICCVGLGTQTDKEGLAALKPGTVKFLRILSDKSSAIGVRGAFTAELLESLGIKNVEVLGCPSMFPNFSQPRIRGLHDFANLTSMPGISFTRFALTPEPDPRQMTLARFAFQHARSIVFQSEIEEIKFLAGETELSRDLADYYGAAREEVVAKLFQIGQCFNNVTDWIESVSKLSIFISSRIHGCVASILAGTPAILLTHDERTKELAETMSIPHSSIKGLNLESVLDPMRIGPKVSEYEQSSGTWLKNRQLLIELYKKNQIPMTV
jgi:hypothetical protein